MSRLRALCILFFIIMYPVINFAQTSSVSTLKETGVWNGLYLKTRVSEKFGYYAEHHYRLRNSEDNLYDFIGRNRQIYNRLGLNIYFNKYFEGVIGPALILNFSPHPGNENYEEVTWEPRIWHQWVFKMEPMGRVLLNHQFRFEHRWKRSNLLNSRHNYTNRYRYKVFAYIPLNKKEIEEKTLFFSPSAEIFMHSGKSVVNNPFEDFRTYNGIGYILNKNITLFAGHMWTYGQEPSGYEYVKTHIIRLNVFIGLDGRKIESRLPTINMGY